MGRAYNKHGGEKKCIPYKIWVEKPEGRRPLGRPKRWWEEDNIKIDFRQLGWGGRTRLI
jgi:hypothetical protein